MLDLVCLADRLTMSRTPYFSGPVVWMDSFSSVLLYCHITPFSITTRVSGSSSSPLRKRWPVSWFFTAGAGNNENSIFSGGLSSSSWTKQGPPPFSYPGCEESLWIPGSTGVGLLWGSPGSSGNLGHWKSNHWLFIDHYSVSNEYCQSPPLSIAWQDRLKYLCNNNFGEPIFTFSFTEHQLSVQQFCTQWA